MSEPGTMPPTPPIARLLVTAGLISAWLILLLVGQSWGGAVHLLLIAGLCLWPWRRIHRALSARLQDE